MHIMTTIFLLSLLDIHLGAVERLHQVGDRGLAIKQGIE
jgi:hypothetical protein